MARYRGRVIIKKVDERGKTIKGSLKDWIVKHPGELYFDSKVEQECWRYMKSAKMKIGLQPTITLFESKKVEEFKKGEIIEYTQRPIKYTPDFYIPKWDVYIEVKGYADELFKVRWKLFKLAGYTGYIVYSVDELKLLLRKLKLKMKGTKK